MLYLKCLLVSTYLGANTLTVPEIYREERQSSISEAAAILRLNRNLGPDLQRAKRASRPRLSPAHHLKGKCQ